MEGPFGPLRIVIVLVVSVVSEFFVTADIVALSFFRECLVLGNVCHVSLRGVWFSVVSPTFGRISGSAGRVPVGYVVVVSPVSCFAGDYHVVGLMVCC